MNTPIRITGTHCQACKMLIEEVGGEQKGVLSVTVDFSTGKGVVDHDGTVDWQKFREEIKSLGDYTVEFSD